MGTSATLAVRYQGRTFIQYTSHDGSPSNVFAEMLSSISAMGVDTLRQAIARQPDPSTIETDFERLVDIHAAGNAYIQACKDRGKEPFGLIGAINFEYGNADFAHGGAIAMLAPQVDWHADQCPGIEWAQFVLDLDHNVLGMVSYDQYEPGDYEKGKVKMNCSVSLDGIENLDPEQVYWHFSYSGITHSDQAQEQTTAVINDLHAGKRVQTGQERHAAYVASDIERYGSAHTTHQDPAPAEPAIYRLSGSLGHIFHFQAVLGLLREKDSEFPILANEGTLRMAVSEEQFDDGPMPIQTLFVDLRQEINPQVHSLVDNAMGAFRREGLVSRTDGPGLSSGRNPFSIFSSFSTASEEEVKGWDEGLIPDNTTNLASYEDFDHKIEQALSEGNIDDINKYYVCSLIDMNQERLDRIEKAGLPGFDINSAIDKAQRLHLTSITITLGESVEEVLPGTLARRYNRLSEENRSRFTSTMTPVDLYLFENALNISQKALETQSPPRRYGIGR